MTADLLGRRRMADALAALLPDTIELWRDPDETGTITAPIANRDEYGFSIRTSAPLQAETGARKIDQCQGQLAPAIRKSRPQNTPEQVVPIAAWAISVPFYKVAQWDLKAESELRTKGRAFKVVDAGGEDSFSPMRVIWCEEIG